MSLKERLKSLWVGPVYMLYELVATALTEFLISLGRTTLLPGSLREYPGTHLQLSTFTVGAKGKTPSHSGLHLAVTTPLQEESEAPLCFVQCVTSMRASTAIFGKFFFHCLFLPKESS